MLHQNRSSKTETFGPLETALPSFVVDMPDGHFMSVRYGSVEWHFQHGVTTVWLILYLSIYVVFYFQIFSIWACLKSMNPPNPIISCYISTISMKPWRHQCAAAPHSLVLVPAQRACPVRFSQNTQCFRTIFCCCAPAFVSCLFVVLTTLATHGDWWEDCNGGLWHDASKSKRSHPTVSNLQHALAWACASWCCISSTKTSRSTLSFLVKWHFNCHNCLPKNPEPSISIYPSHHELDFLALPPASLLHVVRDHDQLMLLPLPQLGIRLRKHSSLQQPTSGVPTAGALFNGWSTFASRDSVRPKGEKTKENNSEPSAAAYSACGKIIIDNTILEENLETTDHSLKLKHLWL